MAEPLLTLAEAARRFRLSPRTLRQAARRGELVCSRPGKRVVYTCESHVQAWLRRLTVPSTPSAEVRAEEIWRRMN